jgi:4-alpha-glucanotransferase
VTFAPLPTKHRASGLLLHVTSLPSPYGIGDVGPSAIEWIDRLHDTGQGWWQALPLGPTGYGDSPYQSLSSFAGNGLLISPDWLIEDGLLKRGDCAAGPFSSAAVDFDAVKRFKYALLETVWRSFRAGARPDLRPALDDFARDQAHWLDDYALFRALKARYGEVSYLEWPESLVRRVPAALDRARADLRDEIDQIRFAQFLLFRQGARLKAHARAKSVRLIGDLPFFVSPDSSDVWANPELFLLDAQHRPRVVAGVPPDYFSARGQLWGNPIYDWSALAARDYRWCIDRMRALLAHVDAIRLDHFRAFAAAWHVPAGAPTAESGQWVPGPGAGLFSAVEKSLGGLPFLAKTGPHHARCGRAPRRVSPSRDTRPPVRLRRPLGQSTSARQLRPQYGRLHGHPRQSDDPRMVRGPARGRAEQSLGLPAARRRERRRGSPRPLASGVVVGRRTGDRAAPGCPESGQ